MIITLGCRALVGGERGWLYFRRRRIRNDVASRVDSGSRAVVFKMVLATFTIPDTATGTLYYVIKSDYENDLY